MSHFIFSALIGFALYQVVCMIQPIAGSGTCLIGRRIVIELPTRTYVVLKAGAIAVAVILFLSIVTLLIAQSVHPTHGYAYRFADALKSPHMAAAVFGGLVGLLFGNLVNRLLRHPADYNLKGSDYLEIATIFFLVILGIGGEEALQSYVRHISKISVGATTEISFSEAQPKSLRSVAEQPKSAFQATHNGEKSGASPGLHKLAKLSSDIEHDKKYIEIIAAFEHPAKNPPARPLEKQIAAIGQLATDVFSPTALCLTEIFYQSGDTIFIDQELREMSLSLRTVAMSARALDDDAKKKIKERIHRRVDSIAAYVEDLGLPNVCKKITETRGHLDEIIKKIIGATDEVKSGRKSLPYVAIADASIKVALHEYEAAAITMQNWIDGHSDATDPAGMWYLLRARFALANYLEEWIRDRGAAAPFALREFHVLNLNKIAEKIRTLRVIGELERGSHDYNFSVGLFGATQSGDDGNCNFPTLPAQGGLQQPLTPEEEDILRNLYESDLSARSSFVDAALKHPIIKVTQASVIRSAMDELMTYDLKCIDPSNRTETRVEHLENLLENSAPFKNADDIRESVVRAQPSPCN